MAEVGVPRTQDTAGTLTQIDGYTLPDGKLQQALVIGDGTTNGRTVAVSAANALKVDGSAVIQSVVLADVTASGTMTVTDAVVGSHGGAGVLLTGVPTAGSFVALALPGGDSGWAVQLVGTFGAGTVWFECSADSSNGTNGNWTTLSLRTIGTNTTVVADSTLNPGLFRGTAAGMSYLRVRITGATTPSVAVVMRVSDAPGPTALNAPLPAGSNVIGSANTNIAVVSGVTTMQAAAVATGNGVSLVTTGYGTAVIQISGTFVASIAFETSVDAGVNWAALSATQIGSGDIFSTVTIPGLFRLTVTAMDLVRARVTWTSGTSITITGRASNAVNASKVVKLATGVNVIGAALTATGLRTVQSFTAVTNGAAVPVGNYAGILLTFTPTALTAYSAAFQLSDDGGTTWYSVLGRNLTTSSTFGTVNGSTNAGSWQVGVAGATHFRLSTLTLTGTSMAVGITPTAAPLQLPVNQQTSFAMNGQNANGLTRFRVVAAATTNATSVKNLPGSLYGALIVNVAAAIRYVRFYDLNVAPTVGTSAVALTIACPANSTQNLSWNPIGIAFAAGISLAITGAAPDADTTVVVAGDVFVTTLYT